MDHCWQRIFTQFAVCLHTFDKVVGGFFLCELVINNSKFEWALFEKQALSDCDFIYSNKKTVIEISVTFAKINFDL
jgi:hypothetical protein